MQIEYAVITNINDEKYSRIFTNIKNGYEYYYNLLFWNNRAQVLSCNGKLIWSVLQDISTMQYLIHS